jgi:hypothetical protein
MKIRSVLAIAVAVAGLSASTNIYAAAKAADTPSLAYVGFAKTKTIKLSLRNDSSASMELKVGDDVVTLDAGKTVTLKLPLGTRVVTNAATPTHQAGTLVAQASSELNGTTVAIR